MLRFFKSIIFGIFSVAKFVETIKLGNLLCIRLQMNWLEWKTYLVCPLLQLLSTHVLYYCRESLTLGYCDKISESHL
jgi:hypothetical protein